ncbi:hypothetical protein PTTG_11697 [Puccinia triticina 1-1 BBBD Race 1]|uniref:Uncharacterized protein n=1 Tax=Puccinia triticina (isolate 1-1 / race 1 (BBBD)) TaxID=630390 RepID=A0A180G5Z8_PUCT1|nr:hypothetical protein PTTG_11697 [Puccinia triticina 1-1 BBBD Race 1]
MYHLPIIPTSIVAVTFALASLLFTWPSPTYRFSQPSSPNLPMINITHTASFLHSCVLLDSMKALEVSKSDLRHIGKLQEFLPNLEAEDELNEGPVIRKSWEELISNLRTTAHHAQILNSNGIWQTKVLLNEYKAFLRPNSRFKVTVDTVVDKFASALQQFILVSNNLTESVQLAILTHQSLQSRILQAHKRLLIETKQRGFFQYCLNLLLGNGWLMRRESELNAVKTASLIVEAVSPFINNIQIMNEIYKNNLLTLLLPMFRNQRYHNPSTPEDFDTPDLDLQIPGEPILCKSDATGEYWPASIKNYAGVRSTRSEDNNNQSLVFQKYYTVLFFDETISEVPRCFFLTSADREFHTVQIGRIHTTETTYRRFYPKLSNVLASLDLIAAGKAQDPTVKAKHKQFLRVPSQQRVVLYGKYSDKLLFHVGQFLRERYFGNAATSLEAVDPRVLQLSDNARLDYISDILLPEALLLITTAEIYEEASSLSVNPRQYATECLKETDIVDLVNCLRWKPKPI